MTKPDKQSRVELIGSWKQQPLWTLTYTAPDKGHCTTRATSRSSRLT
ncbi:hypothetical protein [Kitasatospora aureofaciens]